IRGARGVRPRAGLRHVAVTRRRTADGRCRQDPIQRTLRAISAARLRRVTRARRGPTDRPEREAVRRAGGAVAGARLDDIARTCRGPAYRAGILDPAGRRAAIAAQAIAAVTLLTGVEISVPAQARGGGKRPHVRRVGPPEGIRGGGGGAG